MDCPERVESLFIEPVVNTRRLRQMLYAGKLQSNSPIRAKAWKVLLGCLPADQFMWGAQTSQNAQQYSIYIDKFVSPLVVSENSTPLKEKKDERIVRPQFSVIVERPKVISVAKTRGCDLQITNTHDVLKEGDIQMLMDVPQRSQSTLSRIASPMRLFEKIRPRSCSTDLKKKDNSEAGRIKEQTRVIMKDVPRTKVLLNLEGEGEYNHQNALRRILCCLVCVDKMSYTQGMNELAAVLYYVFCTSGTQDYENAEVSTYFAMKGLLKEYSHYFNAEEDNKEEGIMRAMDFVMSRLLDEDEELYDEIEEKGIGNALYLFRWMSLLFAQDLKIELVLCVWDRLLANLRSRLYLANFCVAMLLSIKQRIIETEFCETIGLLQKFPTDVKFAYLDEMTKILIKYPKKHKADDGETQGTTQSTEDTT